MTQELPLLDGVSGSMGGNGGDQSDTIVMSMAGSDRYHPMMIMLTAMIVLAVDLGAGFGTASATVVSTTAQSIIIEMHVEVDGAPDSVVAHLALPGEQQVTVPLLARADRTYGVTTEIRTADYVVVFEAIGGTGAAESEPVSLSDLGVDLGPGTSTDTTVAEGRSPETMRWLWLGVALAAASLSVLAFWVLGGRDRRDEIPVEDQKPEDQPPSP